MKTVLTVLGCILIFRVYMDASEAGYIDADGVIRTTWNVASDVIKGVTDSGD